MKYAETISIIMPSYNGANYIGETIESVLNQTFSNWKLYIIDDCSSDNTPNIIKRYASLDERIILISNTKNLGPALSRNTGIKICQGRYIAFIDSDDWGISKVDKTFDEHRGVSLLLFNTEKGKKIAQSIGMDDTFYYKEFPSDLAIMNNASLSKCTKLSPTRAQFFDDYQSQGFNFVVDKYLTPRFSFLWKHYYNLPKIIRVLINKI